VGDCIFIPAGIVHALGAGLLVAEIQQSSDTTFRLYDWDRVGSDGNSRELHIDEALATIDYLYGPVTPQTPQPLQRDGVSRLAASEKFVLDRWEVDGPVEIGGDDRFHIVAVLSGSARFEDDPSEMPLERGQTILLPASQGIAKAELSAGTVLMDMYLPVRSDLL
jgi:mannose-6-phosphate isomerase